MSANTGLRPATLVISGTTQKVSAGTMISEPGGNCIALRMSSSAIRPYSSDTARTCPSPSTRANAASNSAMCGP